jgi:hypothetical protein
VGGEADVFDPYRGDDQLKGNTSQTPPRKGVNSSIMRHRGALKGEKTP